MDTKELEAAFLRGFEAGSRKHTAEKFPQYSAVRYGDSGYKQLIADPKLIQRRAIQATNSGVITSIVSAIVAGILGLGVGGALGMPIEGAATGAALGGSLGYLGGSAKGQLDADHKYLADKGYDASVPIPIKELALRQTLSSVAPLSSFARITKVAKLRRLGIRN